MSGECKIYGDLALKYSDIADDNNPVNLFTEILARRDLLDKKENNHVGGEQPTL